MRFIDVVMRRHKEGLVGMTYTLANYLARYNITVNCVVPGRIMESPSELDFAREKQSLILPLGRIGSTAEVVISNTKRIMRPQKAIREAMFKKGIRWVRNMATTAQQLSSERARFPFQLSDEIIKRVGKRMDGATTWRITHPNGTDVLGKIGDVPTPGSGIKRYGERRGEGNNRPFPQGCHNPVSSKEANGVFVLEHTLPMQAKYVGVPLTRFDKPVKVFVENNRMVRFEGGLEAKRLRRFYESLAPQVGDDVWSVCGFHAGISPKARVYESRERFPEAWVEGPHNSSRMVHCHLGAPTTREHDYPFMTHLSCFLGEGATVYIDGEKLYDEGHFTFLDDPETRKLAAQYGDPDTLLSEVTLQA
ncbi:MAG: hypothetical protein HYY45_21135 [Deltaproteobacteria bacterium]|nr:hypothetical protein [Deltaproteobacteria bacterium]